MRKKMHFACNDFWRFPYRWGPDRLNLTCGKAASEESYLKRAVGSHESLQLKTVGESLGLRSADQQKGHRRLFYRDNLGNMPL